MTARILRYFIASSAAIMLLLHARCSTSDVAGGGTDMPNGNVVAGILRAPDSSTVAGAEVCLRQVIITAEGDSIESQRVDTTDTDGKYSFGNVVRGNYILHVCDSAKNLAAINQFITVAADTGNEEIDGRLLLSRRVDVSGHVILPLDFKQHARMRVFVPGMGNAQIPDSTGKYVFAGLPQGEYDIAFAYSDIVNFSHVNIAAASAQKIYLCDYEFALMDTMANAEYSRHNHQMSSSYYISPKSYAEGEAPQWYRDVDTTSVKYYKRSKKDDYFEEWHHDPSEAKRYYDWIAIGALFNNNGTAILVTARGDTMKLIGSIPASFPRMGEIVVAAVRETQNQISGEALFEVVSMAVLPKSYLSKYGENN